MTEEQLLVQKSQPPDDAPGLVESPPLAEFAGPMSTNSSQPVKPPVNLTITRPGGSQQRRYHSVSTTRSGASAQDYSFEDPVYILENFSEKDPYSNLNQSKFDSGRRSYMRQDKRSLILANLPDRTTYQDLVSHIRGGPLVDIFIRADRTASFAFADGSGAQSFFDYTRRNDIYIHTKRVSFFFSTD